MAGGGAERIARVLREEIPQLPANDPYRGILEPVLHELELQTQLSYLEFDAFPKTEDELKAEGERQVNRYFELGLHKHPNIRKHTEFGSKGKFKDSLLRLVRLQPEQFARRFDIPVIPLGRIVPVKDLCNAAGVDYLLDGLEVKDWSDHPKGYQTPDLPYFTWMQDGAKNLDRKVEVVRKTFEVDERGATDFDGVPLHIFHPRIIEHHFMDHPGTSVGADSAPFLNLWYGQPRLYFNWVGNADPEWGSASCGRQI